VEYNLNKEKPNSVVEDDGHDDVSRRMLHLLEEKLQPTAARVRDSSGGNSLSFCLFCVVCVRACVCVCVCTCVCFTYLKLLS